MEDVKTNPELFRSPLASRSISDGIVTSQPTSPITSLPFELLQIICAHVFVPYKNETGMKYTIDLAIIQTCRALYVQTHTLPFFFNTVDDSIDIFSVNSLRLRAVEWQWRSIRRLRLSIRHQGLYSNELRNELMNLPAIYVKPADHESKSMLPFLGVRGCSKAQLANAFTPGPWVVAAHLTHLSLCIAAASWWKYGNISGDYFWLEPCRSSIMPVRDEVKGSGVVLMKNMAEERRSGSHPEYEKDSWGAQIGLLRSLRELILILEVYWYDKDSIDAVVSCAQTWRFPVDDSADLAFTKSSAGSYLSGPPPSVKVNDPAEWQNRRRSGRSRPVAAQESSQEAPQKLIERRILTWRRKAKS